MYQSGGIDRAKQGKGFIMLCDMVMNLDKKNKKKIVQVGPRSEGAAVEQREGVNVS